MLSSSPVTMHFLFEKVTPAISYLEIKIIGIHGGDQLLGQYPLHAAEVRCAVKDNVWGVKIEKETKQWKNSIILS